MKNKIPLKNIIAIVLVVFVLIFAIFEFYSVSTNSVKTQTAAADLYRDTVTAKMMVVRDEKYILSNNAGVPVSIVNDSERVAKGQNIVAYLENDEKAAKYIELQKYQTDLKRYETLMSQHHLMSLDLSKINNEADTIFSSAADAVSSSNIKGIDSIFEKFSNKETTKQILIGGNIDFSEKVNDLKTKIDILQPQVGKVEYVHANETGYYVSFCDGYEDVLNVKNLEKLTCDEFKSALKAKPEEVPQNSMGKVINDYNWYLVGTLSRADASKLKLGQDVPIQCDSISGGYIKSTVKFKGNPENDEVLIVLKSNVMNEDISRLRIEDVQIVLKEVEGIRVNKEAVRVIDGVQGVYILSADIARFRKIEVEYAAQDYVIVKYGVTEERPNKEGLFLKLHDEIIIGGRGIDDGKVIK